MYQGGKDFFIAWGEVYGPDRGAWLPWGVELFPLTGKQIEANDEVSESAHTHWKILPKFDLMVP